MKTTTKATLPRTQAELAKLLADARSQALKEARTACYAVMNRSVFPDVACEALNEIEKIK